MNPETYESQIQSGKFASEYLSSSEHFIEWLFVLCFLLSSPLPSISPSTPFPSSPPLLSPPLFSPSLHPASFLSSSLLPPPPPRTSPLILKFSFSRKMETPNQLKKQKTLKNALPPLTSKRRTNHKY